MYVNMFALTLIPSIYYINKSFLFLFLFLVCFGVFRPTRQFFTRFGNVRITAEGLQILTMLGTHGH